MWALLYSPAFIPQLPELLDSCPIFYSHPCLGDQYRATIADKNR